MKYSNGFFGFLDHSTSPFHVVKNSSEILESEGFECLSFEKHLTGQTLEIVVHSNTLFKGFMDGFFQNIVQIRLTHKN